MQKKSVHFVGFFSECERETGAVDGFMVNGELTSMRTTL